MVLRRRLHFSVASRKLEGLPAVPAITAVAAIPTPAATATVAATPPAATATSAAIAAAASATAAAFSLRPRFIHDEVSPTKVLPVERIDCLVSIFVVCDFNKGEAARLTRKAITDQIDARGSHTDL